MDKLNLMNSLIAVVEEGSYTAAAKKLGKTKALISTHIKQLETALSIRLIARSTRSLHLTEAGQVYYEEARRILDEMANLEAQLHHSTQNTQNLVGRLRLSVSTAFGERIVMPFIADMMRAHPQLNIEIMLTERYVDLISEGFDCAIRIGHLKDASFIARQVGCIKLRLCASPEFIQHYGMPTHPEALRSLPCIMDTNYKKSGKWVFSADAITIAINVNNVVTVNSALAAVNLALNNIGVVFCPDFMVNKHIQAGQLIALLPSYTAEHYPIHIIYPHRQYLSSKISVFSEQFANYLQENKEFYIENLSS